MKMMVMMAVAVISMMCGSAQVIAASDADDQPAGAVSSEGTGGMPVEEPPAISSAPNAIDGVVLLASIAILVLIVRRKWHRLNAAPNRIVPFTPPAGIVLLAGFMVLAQFGAAGAAYAFGIKAGDEPHSLMDQAKILLGAYSGQSIALAAYVWLDRVSPRAAGGDQPRFGKSMLTALAAFVLTWPMVVAASTCVAVAVWIMGGEAMQTIAHSTLRTLLHNPVDAWWIVMVMLVLLLAPVMEEVMYRGVLQSLLIRNGVRRWPAIIITSAVFALMHGSVAEAHAVAALFVLSLAFGWALERTGRLATPILMHVLFNAANMAMAMVIG